MVYAGTRILKIEPLSPAARAGLRSGDRVILCNKSPIADWVDFLALSSASRISLLISRGPIKRTINLQRRPGVQWGILLEGSNVRSCRNKCVFCFVAQQPPGLRSSLLLKDDDVRYSFLNGTYITLTSEQVDEAIARGFSSLHVSVQTTNPVLRGKMLGLPGSIEILPQIDRLDQYRIDIQAQVVEVPDWNNGTVLEETITALYKRKNVTILGIVPVGLTKWRKDLEQLNRHTDKQAANTLKTVKKWQEKAMRERGTPWIYPADEYYAIAHEDVPPKSFYDDCSLAANGIGLLAEMIDRCSGVNFAGKGIIITGTMAAPYIAPLVAHSGYKIVPVENTLMGSMVSVAGLLSGKDVVEAVQQHRLRDEAVFLPSVMFNHHGVTLDEYTLENMMERTGAEITSINSIGELS